MAILYVWIQYYFYWKYCLNLEYILHLYLEDVWPTSFSPHKVPSKNIPGIPAESRRNSGPHLAGLVWNSRWIPGGFRVKSTGIRWNPPELLPAFPWYSAGIPDYSVRNSAGIIAGIPPVFHRNSGLEFRRNYCRHSPGIPPELLPAFPRYSTGIIAGIPPVFHRNSAGIIAVIPPAFHQNYGPEFCRNYCRHFPGILGWNSTELLPAFSWYSTGILGWNFARIIADILPVFDRNSGGVIASIVPVFIRK